ncbi:MAG: response regulator [Nitrospirota bacterium]
MANGKILCIDDTPDEVIETSKKTLRETVHEIFKGLLYEIMFGITGKDGLELISKDKDIKLVLLDIQFEGQEMQGSEIADSLFDLNKNLKIIVLTKLEDTGKKRSFGWKPNVIGYVIKKDIANPGNRSLIKNLAEAVIDDPENKKWVLYLDTDKKRVKLLKGNERYEFSIPRSQRKWLLLEACANNPNKCMSSFDIQGFIELDAQYPEYVNKEVSQINETVLNKTGWRTWGILDTDCPEQSSARLIIGDVKIDEEKIPTYRKSPEQLITLTQFEEFKKNIESRLKKLEEEIFSLKNR